MTNKELSIVLKVIDKYTIRYEYQPGGTSIDDVQGLKELLIIIFGEEDKPDDKSNTSNP